MGACGIWSCDRTDIDERGPVAIRIPGGDQWMDIKVCRAHFSAIFRIIGQDEIDRLNAADAKEPRRG